jgi:molybdopterin-guanine dinucleotide biosynthesis protein A
MTDPVLASQITGVVLAGGRAVRMGGVDKGLQVFQGQTLIEHALQRLRPQVAHVGINANRHLDQYQNLGCPVWPDATSDFSGPLAGFAVGLSHCQTPYLLTVPCDTPFFPLDLASRLASALTQAQTDIAMVVAAETDEQNQTQWRTQPVFCLLKTELLPSLQSFMQAGGRKIDAWTAQHPCTNVRFDAPHDHPQAFFNINTLQQLQALESPLTRP